VSTAHSTVQLWMTLVDSTGQTVNMGSAIDELSPDRIPITLLLYQPEQHYHSHRQLLWDVMRYSGFSAIRASGGISP